MKHLFTDDRQGIAKEIDLLIEKKADLICGKGGAKSFKKLALKGKTKSPVGDLIIVDHPHEPTCSSDTCLYYYHLKGNPLRCFEAQRVRKVNNLLGLKYPTAIYDIHHRIHPRATTAGNSTVTFSLLNKQRVHYGKVADISLQGAKLLVNIPFAMSAGDQLCHLTMTLCSRFSSISEAQIHIPEARVVWLQGDDNQTNVLGVQFALHEKGQDALSDYIDLRSMEDQTNSSNK